MARTRASHRPRKYSWDYIPDELVFDGFAAAFDPEVGA
jgi:hypothetical protein